MVSPQAAPARIPDEDHVIRFARARHVDLVDGREIAMGSAFVVRASDDHALSVNWQELVSSDLDAALAAIRATTRLVHRGKDRLARFAAGRCRAHVAIHAPSRRLVDLLHDPAEATATHPADPSHALVTNMPGIDDLERDLVGDLIAQCVIDLHTALA